MHEMPIAVDIVDRAVEVAQQHHATRIDEVQVDIGVMRQVVPEALELAFSVASEGTLAEGAELRITEEEAVAVCRNCQCRFSPEIGRFVCPQCEQANVRIVAGSEIILKTIVCQADEEASVP